MAFPRPASIPCSEATPAGLDAPIEGWSLHGAQPAQGVAIGGRRSDPESGGNKPEPLPWIATGCRQEYMVGRGRSEYLPPAARSAGDVASLSMKTRFRGPLVAQTSLGRLAQPCGAEDTSERKVPANEPVQRRSRPGVVVPESACHAGGRGFESRRSRLRSCPANQAISC